MWAKKALTPLQFCIEHVLQLQNEDTTAKNGFNFVDFFLLKFH